jgi:hypothetical protein
MNKYAQTMSDLNDIVTELEELGMEKQAVQLHTAFVKMSSLLIETFNLLEDKQKENTELTDMILDYIKKYK